MFENAQIINAGGTPPEDNVKQEDRVEDNADKEDNAEEDAEKTKEVISEEKNEE